MKPWSLLALPFRRLLIRNKIIAVYIPIILIPLFAPGYFTSHLFTNSLIAMTKENVRDESTLILTRIDSMISSAESSANTMMEDFNHIYENFPAPLTPFQENQLRIQMQAQFSVDLLNFPAIDSAAFIDSRGQLYTSYFPARDGDRQVFDSGLIAKINEMPSYGGGSTGSFLSRS